MVNFKLTILIFLISSLLFSDNLLRQTSLNDANWEIDTAKSDEFDSTTLNPAKWHILDCPSGDCCNFGGGTAFEKGNAIDSGGRLCLRTDGPGQAPLPCSRYTYATGGITSDSFNYSYGYFERSARLPGSYNAGQPCGQKFEPDFWMAYQKYDATCLTVHNEIDIFEPGGYEYNGNTNVCGWWYQNGNCGNYTPGHQKYVSPTPLFLAYHKLAVEWLPNALVFFMDDIPIYENYNSPTFIMYPLKIFMDIQLEDSTEKFCPGIVFPQYMQIDYFGYYKLKLDRNTSSVILTNSDLTNYVFSVKSDITIGNGGSTISLNPTDNKYFRAVNSITIYGDFTAPLGSELALLPSQCY